MRLGRTIRGGRNDVAEEAVSATEDYQGWLGVFTAGKVGNNVQLQLGRESKERWKNCR